MPQKKNQQPTYTLTLEDHLASFNIHKASYPRSQTSLAELPKTDHKVYLDDLCKHLTLKNQKHQVLLSNGNTQCMLFHGKIEIKLRTSKQFWYGPVLIAKEFYAVQLHQGQSSTAQTQGSAVFGDALL